MSEFLDKYAARKDKGFWNNVRRGHARLAGNAYGWYRDDMNARQGGDLAVDLLTDRNGTTDIVNRTKLFYDSYKNGGSIDSLQSRMTSVANDDIKFLFKFMDPSEIKKMSIDEISRGVSLRNDVDKKGNGIGKHFSKEGIGQLSKFVDQAEQYGIQSLSV